MQANILMLLFVAFSLSVQAQKKNEFVVNVGQSTVKWAGKKIVGGNTEGTISLQSGKMILEGERLTAGEFVLSTNTIASSTASSRLISHLKNEDFFDVEKYPTAKFVITNVKSENGKSMITGNMTIKGITKAITFPATILTHKNRVEAKVSGVKVDRTQYGIQYNSGSIFTSLGDKAIEDHFVLDISIIAEKK
ncbi:MULTISPECIES: YceI family protein [Sphingobacterium]|uniref:YceI family protein n=1 Tax=Sphingobacterium TaxID=28453 RepID=UPI0013DCAE52|nr:MULTISPECIES: YceI family protein [unclassified Sphingobacterium]